MSISPRVHAVIPSISADTEDLSSIVAPLSRAGVTVTVVANSSSLTTKLNSTTIPFQTSQRNAGFAASINMGAMGRDWDWLLILNDDLIPDGDEFAGRILRELEQAPAAAVIHLDGEPSRPIPGVFATLGNVSMTNQLLRKLGAERFEKQRKNGSYRSFSAVAINRFVWDEVGGLNERYGFTFEDADFARHAHSLGIETAALTRPAARHLHSISTGKRLSEVLPVSTFSALEYLDEWYGHRNLMRALVAVALLCRIPLALARPNRARHLKGIGASLKAVLFDHRPELPAWEEI